MPSELTNEILKRAASTRNTLILQRPRTPDGARETRAGANVLWPVGPRWLAIIWLPGGEIRLDLIDCRPTSRYLWELISVTDLSFGEPLNCAKPAKGGGVCLEALALAAHWTLGAIVWYRKNPGDEAEPRDLAEIILTKTGDGIVARDAGANGPRSFTLSKIIRVELQGDMRPIWTGEEYEGITVHEKAFRRIAETWVPPGGAVE